MLNANMLLAKQSAVLAALPALADRGAVFEDARMAAPKLTGEDFREALADLEWGGFLQDRGSILLLTSKGLRARRRLLATLEGRPMPGRVFGGVLPSTGRESLPW